jgi:hypothetical protein
MRRGWQLFAVRIGASGDIPARHSNDGRRRACNVPHDLSWLVPGSGHTHSCGSDYERSLGEGDADRVSRGCHRRRVQHGCLRLQRTEPDHQRTGWHLRRTACRKRRRRWWAIRVTDTRPPFKWAWPFEFLTPFNPRFTKAPAPSPCLARRVPGRVTLPSSPEVP